MTTSTSPEPIDPRELRISDAEREVAAERVRIAAGEGRLAIDELEERIEAVYAAKTYAELEPITRDLPVTSEIGRTVVTPSGIGSRFRIGAKPGRKMSLVVMGGSENKGAWVVPRKYTALACMGGIVLDLREAQFEDREATIFAGVCMGGIEIIVPEGLNVQVHGFGFMGGYSGTPSGEVVPDGPIVHVRGFAVMGGVDVKRRGPKKDKKDKDKKDKDKGKELGGGSQRGLAG